MFVTVKSSCSSSSSELWASLLWPVTNRQGRAPRQRRPPSRWAPATVTVPVTRSGPDQTYETGRSAPPSQTRTRGRGSRVHRDFSEVRRRLASTRTSKARRSGTGRHPGAHMERQRPYEGRRLGDMLRFKDWYWGEPKVYEDVELRCDVPLELENVASIEVLGTPPGWA